MACSTVQHGSTVSIPFVDRVRSKTDGNKQTGAEVLPIALRSRVMGLAAASHFIVNVGITEAGPSAFAHVSIFRRYKKIRRVETSTEKSIQIKENYYYVFVACSFFFFVVAYLYFPYVYFTGGAPFVTNADTSQTEKPDARLWRKLRLRLATRS